MSRPSFSERCQVYREIIESFLERFEKIPPPIHVPKLSGLRRQHPNMIFHLTPELFLQESGCTEFSCPEDRFQMRPGEMTLMPRGVPHGEVASKRRGSRFRALVFCFDGNELRIIASKDSPESRPMPDYIDLFEGPEVTQALRYIDDAAAACLKASPTAEARRRALLFAALSVVHDALRPERLTHRTQSHEHPKVRHCHGLIGALLSEPRLSVGSLAQQLSCSPDHLSRCFRLETGMSVLAYIRNERLSRAKDLLQDPRLNISEIAWACGFSTLNYFVRVFRQATGQPPRQFQRSLAPAKPRASSGLGRGRRG